MVHWANVGIKGPTDAKDRAIKWLFTLYGYSISVWQWTEKHVGVTWGQSCISARKDLRTALWLPQDLRQFLCGKIPWENRLNCLHSTNIWIVSILLTFGVRCDCEIKAHRNTPPSERGHQGQISATAPSCSQWLGKSVLYFSALLLTASCSAVTARFVCRSKLYREI